MLRRKNLPVGKNVPDFGVMLMVAVAKLYLSERSVSAGYASSLLRTAGRLDERLITTETIGGGEVNAFIASLSTLTSSTQKNLLREVLTLWRFAFDRGLTDAPVRGVRRVKAVLPPTEAWHIAEIRRLLAAAESDTTEIGGRHSMSIKRYMPCWIRIGYETGLRHGDILSLNDTEIRNCRIAKVASKTGKPIVRRIEGETQAMAMQLLDQSPDGSLFSWFLTRRRSFTVMKEFLIRHNAKGSSKYLRRSCATYIALRSKEAASQYLQHTSMKLLDHYVDETLIDCLDGPPALSASG